MAGAWGSSWGSSWGAQWGSGELPPVIVDGVCWGESWGSSWGQAWGEGTPSPVHAGSSPAWGDSWGGSWGTSWGALAVVSPPAANDGGGGGPDAQEAPKRVVKRAREADQRFTEDKSGWRKPQWVREREEAETAAIAAKAAKAAAPAAAAKAAAAPVEASVPAEAVLDPAQQAALRRAREEAEIILLLMAA